jgi:hypothetical protein
MIMYIIPILDTAIGQSLPDFGKILQGIPYVYLLFKETHSSYPLIFSTEIKQLNRLQKPYYSGYITLQIIDFLLLALNICGK